MLPKTGIRFGAVVVVLVVVAGLLIAFARRPTRKADNRPFEAALAARQWDVAEESLRERKAHNPEDADTLFDEARLDFARKRLNEAFDAIRNARKRGYPAEPLDRLLGLVYAEGGKFAEAEPILMPVLDHSGGRDLEVAEALAGLFLKTYKLPLAAIVLRRWIEVAPDDAKPYLWLTEIDKRTEADQNITIAHYREALKRDDSLDQARLGLAATLLATRRYAEAAAAFDEYIERKPDDPEGHLGAARAARDLGENEASKQHLVQTLKLVPDQPVALRESASLELRQGDFQKSLGFLERALKRDPNDSEALYLQSLALARLGRNDEADAARKRSATLRKDEKDLIDIQALILKDPADLSFRCRVARWMFDHGRDDEAVRWAKYVVERDQTNAEMNALLAEYHAKRGEAGLANYYRMQFRDRK